LQAEHAPTGVITLIGTRFFMARYRHTQLGTVILLFTLGIGVPVTLLLVAGQLVVPAIVAVGVLALTLLLFGWLTVSVGDDTLDVRFGVGLIKKRIQLSNVRSFQKVRNPWYWGWGIRLYPGGWLYNVSGLDAVELVLRDGKELRVGTDEPEELERALVRALGKSQPIDLEEQKTRVKRTRRWQLVILAVTVLLVGGVGGLVYAETRPPRVSLDATEFHVKSAVYGMDIPLDDIESLSLESDLPRILARTNGTGAGRTLRGHFRLERLGEGQLFLEYGSAPYLFVRTQDSFVYVGYSDPALTRQVYAELKAALVARGRVL
jgi:hypothetical protein